MNHSPLPWHCFADRDVNTGYVRKGIATESGWGLCEAQDRDDAAFIVHACNHFEQLLTATERLKDAIGCKYQYGELEEDGCPCIKCCGVKDALKLLEPILTVIEEAK